MSTSQALTYSIRAAEAVKVDRYMGLDIVLTGASEYRVTDVNGISYFEQTPDRLKILMRAHGRKVLKTKHYMPRRQALTPVGWAL